MTGLRAHERDRKLCAVCGVEFHRREHQSKRNWSEQQACSRPCMAKKLSTDRTKPRDPCIRCGRHIPRDSPRFKGHNRWCSIECRNAWKFAQLTYGPPAPNRTCPTCGVRFHTDVEKRVHCSNACRANPARVTIELHGVELQVVEVAEMLSVSSSTVRKRARDGLSVLGARKVASIGDALRGRLKICGFCGEAGHNRRTCPNPSTPTAAADTVKG